MPVSVNPLAGDVHVSPTDPSSTEPTFVVEPGDGTGDKVEYTFENAKDETHYVLWSVSSGIVRDDGTANSPLTLTDDDSNEKLQFQVDENTGSSDSGGGGGSSSVPNSFDEVSAGGGALGAASLGDVGIIVIVGGLIAGAWVISREFGGSSLSSQTLLVSEAIVVGLLALELLSQYSLVGGAALGFAKLGKLAGVGLQQAMPLALLVGGGVAYFAIKRWGRPQVVVKRSFSIGGDERGEE
ncbi:hypothetical protein VB773_14275 [Haloarculaceae archaeon H-GB2-1]|nr:hypothetical protein [Haloarculaceae archaeon H-GB2-1]